MRRIARTGGRSGIAATTWALGAWATAIAATAEAKPLHEDAAPADLVVINAKVWTGDAHHPHAERFAVRGGVFVGVDDEVDVAAFTGPDTVVFDAGGRRILPGLIDTHVHLGGAAADFRYLDLRAATSKQDLLKRLADYARPLGPDDWVVGTRWSSELWPDQTPPGADEIDAATGGRKAVLIRMDGHSLLASRSALEYANITKDGPADPPGGTIGRLADGTPSGGVFEQAMGLVQRHVRLPAVDERELLLKAVREANRFGVTQVGAIEGPDTLRQLAELDREGKLTLRIAGTIRGAGDSLSAWEAALKWGAENASPSPMVRVVGFKGYMDGSLGSRTAWMMEPYLDNHMAPDKSPDNAGYPLAMAAEGTLADLIRLGAGMGLQPAVHAIGDQSNHVLLNWYESLTSEQRKALRPRIEHAQHLLPGDVARFGALGVVPSMQPYHKADDGRYAEQRIGPERIKSSYAFRQLLDSGALLAFGSDWPVVSVDPFLGIHAAVSARTLDDKVFAPEQSITVEEALTCYTRSAAACLLSESSTGMIRAGYAADFIVLDRDVLAAPAEQLRDIRVLRTFVAGRPVYERAE